MSKTLHLVSICIPTYNGEEFINEALDSAISQTYSNLEIIISDDNSTDNTLTIIESYRTKTSIPIFIYHHEPNGIGANWNNCIKKANGDYIKFLFQDDVLLPECVKEMVSAFDHNDLLGMVACKRTIIYKEDYAPEVVKNWLNRCADLQKNLKFTAVNGVIVFNQNLFKDKQFLKSPLNKIGEPTAFMFKKEVIKKCGYFSEDLKQILDYEFCYRLLKKYNIAIILKELVQFRLHATQATNVNRLNEDGKADDSYSKILYKNYLNYVDAYTKRHLLKKYNVFYKFFYKIKSKIPAK